MNPKIIIKQIVGLMILIPLHAALICPDGTKDHYFSTGERHCCVEITCPPGTEAVSCIEGQPNTTACRPCNGEFTYQDVAFKSTEGRTCKLKNTCDANSGKASRDYNDWNVTTKNRQCKCSWDKNYYDPADNGRHSDECHYCGNTSGYIVDGTGKCVKCEGKVEYDDNGLVSCVKSYPELYTKTTTSTVDPLVSSEHISTPKYNKSDNVPSDDPNISIVWIVIIIISIAVVIGVISYVLYRFCCNASKTQTSSNASFASKEDPICIINFGEEATSVEQPLLMRPEHQPADDQTDRALEQNELQARAPEPTESDIGIHIHDNEPEVVCPDVQDQDENNKAPSMNSTESPQSVVTKQGPRTGGDGAPASVPAEGDAVEPSLAGSVVSLRGVPYKEGDNEETDVKATPPDDNDDYNADNRHPDVPSTLDLGVQPPPPPAHNDNGGFVDIHPNIDHTHPEQDASNDFDFRSDEHQSSTSLSPTNSTDGPRCDHGMIPCNTVGHSSINGPIDARHRASGEARIRSARHARRLQNSDAGSSDQPERTRDSLDPMDRGGTVGGARPRIPQRRGATQVSGAETDAIGAPILVPPSDADTAGPMGGSTPQPRDVDLSDSMPNERQDEGNHQQGGGQNIVFHGDVRGDVYITAAGTGAVQLSQRQSRDPP